MISWAWALTAALAPFWSFSPRRLERAFIWRTNSARATMEAAATTGSSSALVRMRKSKPSTPSFTSSRCTRGVSVNWSSRPQGLDFSFKASCRARACWKARIWFWLRKRVPMSWLYWRMSRHCITFTTTPGVWRMRWSSSMILDSDIFLESCAPALRQASIMDLSAITVAAMSGPKKSPLPDSSSPAWGSNQSGWSTSS